MIDENYIVLTPSAEDVGSRLDAFVARKIHGWSRAQLKRLINEGDILVNDEQAKPAYRVRIGDRIEVELVEIPTARFRPENIPLDILFEDEFLAVVNKPAGMVVHPGAGINSGTLANAIAWHFKLKDERTETGEDICRVGIVHRLDKETSGLLVVAKSQEIQEKLSEQFRNRTVQKKYVALVHGVLEQDSGRIEAGIGRNRKLRTKMQVSTQGRYALSLWKVLKRYHRSTLVEVEIKTGRTHQIRVHMAYIGHPLVGDRLYNSGRDKTVPDPTLRNAISQLNRFFLHSNFLSFTHPVTKQILQFSSPLPNELKIFLEKFDKLL